MQRSFTFVCLLVVCLVCIGPLAAQETVVWPTEEWPTSTPEEQGMDSAELAALFTNFSYASLNLDSLLVVRNGHIVAEAYSPLHQPDPLHYMYSVSKSVTSVVIGALIQQGYLESVSVPVLSLFPDRDMANVDANKEAMTVRDLLTLTAGLECDDSAFGTVGAMIASEDWVQFMLDLPMADTPGTTFNYCNGVVHILSGIVTELTGKPMLEFAADSVFAPLGITDYAWSSSPTGVTLGLSDLQLTTRDMAKIGYLVLHNGEWNGQQILPADYVQESLSPQVRTGWPSAFGSYGYLWWGSESPDRFYANGQGGQYIEIVPGDDLVVVLTGSAAESTRWGGQIMDLGRTIDHLTTEDGPLPANPEGLSALEAHIDAIENPAPQAVDPLPELASLISGVTYALERPIQLYQKGSLSGGEVAVNALSLAFPQPEEALLTLTTAGSDTLELPVGLDGLYRVSDSPVGSIGLKGRWNSDNQFQIDIKYVGDAWLQMLTLDLTPESVTLTESEFVLGFTNDAIRGVVQE